MYMFSRYQSQASVSFLDCMYLPVTCTYLHVCVGITLVTMYMFVPCCLVPISDRIDEVYQEATTKKHWLVVPYEQSFLTEEIKGILMLTK